MCMALTKTKPSRTVLASTSLATSSVMSMISWRRRWETLVPFSLAAWATLRLSLTLVGEAHLTKRP